MTDHIYDRSVIERERSVVRFRTDGRSYILPSRLLEDPDATVLFLGGSTTECEAVPEEVRFPTLVSTLLAKRGYRVNTLNAAHSGNTIHDSLNILLNRAVADHPDIAVMMHVTNDIGVLAESGDYSTRMVQAVGLSDVVRWAGQVGSSRMYLLGWLRRWLTTRPLRELEGPRGAGGYVAVASAADEYRARLRAFVGICRAFGIEPVLMTEPLANFETTLTPRWADNGAQSAFNDFIRQIGVDEGVLVIDLVRFLEEGVPDWNEPMKLFYDGMHVNDVGSRSYAEHIAATLAADVLPHVGKRRNVQVELQASAQPPLEKVNASIVIDKPLPAP